MFIVICYDITDNRRRNRVAKILEGSGQRVQESVFECHLDPQRLRSLQERLLEHLDPHTDCLRTYTLCGKDLQHVQWRGQGQAPADTPDWVI